jgi:hypothetical protein
LGGQQTELLLEVFLDAEIEMLVIKVGSDSSMLKLDITV